MAVPLQDRIEKARLQASQAKARLQALEARLSDSDRKLDTRRKIILGGLLIDAASKDERYAKVVSALMQRIDRDNDRKAFDGWEPPGSTAAPQPVPATADGADSQPSSG